MSVLEKIVRAKNEEIAELKATSSIDEWKSRAADSEPPRDFLSSLKGAPPIRLIAEVKKASPSQGVIRKDFDPVEIAKAYEKAGASCISVLTDPLFFQGQLEFLQAIRSAVSTPLLRKDFILDPAQVWQARAFGADAVLLIAECLEPDQMKRLHEVIIEAGMTPLVELYLEKNIDPVMALNPQLVGVNNRDLTTFEVDLQHSIRMFTKMTGEHLCVSESGIFSNDDAKCLENAGIDAMLVGQSLCEQSDVYSATKTLLDGNSS